MQRHEQSEQGKPCVDDETDIEDGDKTKKYDNGKPKKSQKKQTHYFEELL